MKRSPVVVIVGHVDHGKTSLLDYIRKTAIVKKEAGGITQSIGAYEVVHNNERITFIDTPGHEAFKAMRKRGANIADVAILAVAVDDGVQNQTKEALKVLQETETPFIVAITKIDKSGVDIDRVKNQLMAEGVLLEGYGGAVSWHGISSKTGGGVNELLDLILLTAEVEELTYDPAQMGSGYILESKLVLRKGIEAIVIVKNGVVREGEYIRAGGAIGKIKILHNAQGKKVNEVYPSSPAVIYGFESIPEIGAEFTTSASALEAIAQTKEIKTTNNAPRQNELVLNIILKADAGGSLEALSGVVQYIPAPPEIRLRIIEQSVGEITDGDIQSAISHKAAVLGFRTVMSKAAKGIARQQHVTVTQSEVLYDLTKTLEEMIKSGTVIKPVGILEILAVFGKKGGGQQIIGGKVIEGEMRSSATVEIHRSDKPTGKTGRIINLQQQKKDAPRVLAGNECGMLFESEIKIEVGDKLILR